MAITNVQFSVSAHILTVLGYFYGLEITSATLAGSVNAEPTFVRRAIAKLSKDGLIDASRGRNGACQLARPPEKITLLDVYRASEAPGTFALHAYPVQETCPVSSNIKGCMTGVLNQVQHGFEKSLAKVTIADLVAGIREGELNSKRHISRG